MMILEEREGQVVEFKKSLAEQDDGTQSLVAFANAGGSKVFFGVEDDGTVVGADVGANTLEQLAADIRDHTYPSLPVYIEEKTIEQLRVVIVEVGADVPPVVGVYLYSSNRLPANHEIDASNLKTYRRVGRVDQKDDFMRLRASLPSDPRVRLTLPLYRFADAMDQSLYFEVRIWIEEGSGSAHDISFRTDPAVGPPQGPIDDLPFPAGKAGSRYVAQVAPFELNTPTLLTDRPSLIRVIASYQDDWGLTWESSRELLMSYTSQAGGSDAIQSAVSGALNRRIVMFPPKLVQP